MKLITFKRGEMIQTLLEISPVKIMTFSPIDCDSSLKDLTGCPMNVIMNTRAFKDQSNKPKDWEFRTNNKIHSKIAIGLDGLMIGSWNFSNNSTNIMHEAVAVIEPSDSNWEEMWIAFNKYFDEMWRLCKK